MADNLIKDFDLPEVDVECLDARGLDWETIKERDNDWLILRDFPVPNGYSVNKADAAILIPASYPTTQLDMVYFYPALQRSDGLPIGAVQGTVVIQGRHYQQWSRHRTSVNPWRPGVDNLSTHLSAIEEWLLREFKKRVS